MGAGGEPITLKDGARVLIRPVTPADKPLFAEGFERFGDESRYRRFLATKKRLTSRELVLLTEVDHHDHEALGAVEPQRGRGLGVARYVRHAPGSEGAEVAVAVVDAWQGRGLGWALLSRLARRAGAEGVTHFCARLFAYNTAMLTLFRRLGRVEVLDREDSVLLVDVALPLDDDCLREVLRAAAAGEVVA